MINEIKQLIIEGGLKDKADLSRFYNGTDVKTKFCIFRYPYTYKVDTEKVAITLSVFLYYPNSGYMHYSGRLIGDYVINMESKLQLTLVNNDDKLFKFQKDWTWFNID